MPARSYRAGDSLEDYCRVCKTDRIHTVMAADPGGAPIRVVCGYCRSEHNYRGGPRIETSPPPTPPRPQTERAAVTARERPATSVERPATPPAVRPEPAPASIVSARERAAPPMSHESTPDLEMLLRRIIREETGLTPVSPAPKWRGGSLVLRPGTPGLQEKSWPIETFFHKVVMLRNRLRTLEQQLNASDLPEDAKIKLQGYITGCYGSLTSFNVLFADVSDQFKGAEGDRESD
jgi:hypothetical protein